MRSSRLRQTDLSLIRGYIKTASKTYQSLVRSLLQSKWIRHCMQCCREYSIDASHRHLKRLNFIYSSSHLHRRTDKMASANHCRTMYGVIRRGNAVLGFQVIGFHKNLLNSGIFIHLLSFINCRPFIHGRAQQCCCIRCNWKKPGNQSVFAGSVFTILDMSFVSQGTGAPRTIRRYIHSCIFVNRIKNNNFF